MELRNKATKLQLSDFRSAPMRAFHMAWFSFFLCFFAWFGIAPLMVVVRKELGLTPEQIGNTIIASVAITIVARLVIGYLCDRLGPRLAFSGLLIVGSLPVMGIGLATSYESFLLFRLAIGVIGAGFVITQYHTSINFAPNVVGTANATAAGWGNLGGGVTQFAMPLLFAAMLGMGLSEFWSWRLCMVAAGVVCLAAGVAYFLLTQDAPEGNFAQLRREGKMLPVAQTRGSFLMACKDHRVWSLALIYGACFGIELTINNVAALYFADYFGLGLAAAGLAAGLFGVMNIFARSLGGVFGDRFGMRWGLRGRVVWLFIALFFEGIALIVFSRMGTLAMALASLVVFSLFVQMAEGATFSVVPFINKRALGSVSGIVGAGGNIGAVMAGFLMKGSSDWRLAFLTLGVIVVVCAFVALTIRFSHADEKAVEREVAFALDPIRA